MNPQPRVLYCMCCCIETQCGEYHYFTFVWDAVFWISNLNHNFNIFSTFASSRPLYQIQWNPFLLFFILFWNVVTNLLWILLWKPQKQTSLIWDQWHVYKHQSAFINMLMMSAVWLSDTWGIYMPGTSFNIVIFFIILLYFFVWAFLLLLLLLFYLQTCSTVTIPHVFYVNMYNVNRHQPAAQLAQSVPWTCFCSLTSMVTVGTWTINTCSKPALEFCRVPLVLQNPGSTTCGGGRVQSQLAKNLSNVMTYFVR